MKHIQQHLYLPVLACLLLLANNASAQTWVKQWDYRYGGLYQEQLTSFITTVDHGYLLAGTTNSDTGLDISDTSRNTTAYLTTDYWIVKLDSMGLKQWDKRFGGGDIDHLQTIIQTVDRGYLLGGTSNSGQEGDKSQASNSEDFWIIKTDSNGDKVWDKTYGGDAREVLSAVTPDVNGGYLLAGYSSSGINGDKTEACRDTSSQGGYDYWAIKIDADGNKQWDKTFGGWKIDYMQAADATSDGGYILAGFSLSGADGDKSEVLKDSVSYINGDYWVIKIDSVGNRQWDKTLGGTVLDRATCVRETNDHGFIVGGVSNSPVSGDKSQQAWGTGLQYDYWVVKLDKNGQKQWDKRFGGNYRESLYNIELTSDNGYLLTGTSSSQAFGDKTENNLQYEQGWLVKIDSDGNKIWDKTILTGGTRLYYISSFGLLTADGCYAIAGDNADSIGGYRTQLPYNPTVNDFWIVKLCLEKSDGLGQNVAEDNFSVYPNPATNQLSINTNGLPVSDINIYNTTGQLVLVVNQPQSNTIDISSLNNGIYITEIKTKAASAMRRWVKM